MAKHYELIDLRHLVNSMTDIEKTEAHKRFSYLSECLRGSCPDPDCDTFEIVRRWLNARRNQVKD